LLTKKSRIVILGRLKIHCHKCIGIINRLDSFVTDYSIEFKKTEPTPLFGITTDRNLGIDDNKEDIITTSSAANSLQAQTYHEIETKEMWTKYTYSNGDYDEIHYKQK